MICNKLPKKHLLSINISLGMYQEFIDAILSYSKNKMSDYVCVANVHMCIEAYLDTNFAEVVNNAILVTPDGMPIVKALKFLFGINQDKVSGPDLMPDLLKEIEKKNLSIFLYGSTQEILDELIALFHIKYPNLSIVGSISPPFRDLTIVEQDEYINKINSAKPNLVFVALGCPKQERWMASMKGKIQSLMIGVGGAFPMLVGKEKRAPLWMQQYSLEWFYRFLQQPRRLFKRYFVTNSLFIYIVLREKWRLS